MREAVALLLLATGCVGAPGNAAKSAPGSTSFAAGDQRADQGSGDQGDGDDQGEDELDDLSCESAGPITLTLTHAGQPAEGVRVIFQGCNSAVLADVLTDADGIAQGQVTPGGFVTVVDTSWVAKAVTFTDVSPGDHLVTDGFQYYARPTDVPTTFVNFGLKVPRLQTPVPLQVDYRVIAASPCGGSASLPISAETADTVTFAGSLSSQCPMPVDLLIHAAYGAYSSGDGTSGGPYDGTFYVPNVTLADGDMLDLSDRTYEPLVEHTTTVNSAPDLSWWLVEDLATPHGWIHETQLNLWSETSVLNVAIAAPPLPSPSAELKLMTALGQVTTHQVMSRAALGPATSGGYSVDTGALLLTDVPVCPVLDAVARTVTWETGTVGREPTVVVVEIEPSPFAYPEWGRWKLVAPPDRRVRLPRLPELFPHLDTLAPNLVRTNVRRMNAATGHAALRAGALWPRDTYQWDLDESGMTESECFNSY